MWALELLLVLKKAGRPYLPGELVSVLRASELVVSNASDSLIAAGFVSIDDHGVRYLPVNDEIAEKVERIEMLYAARPNSVRRAIISSASSGATAFADAFKLRKDR